MVGMRGCQSSPNSCGGSDGRKASKKGNYWKVLEGKGFDAYEQVLKDVHATEFDLSVVEVLFKDQELPSLDEEHFCKSAMESDWKCSSVLQFLDSLARELQPVGNVQHTSDCCDIPHESYLGYVQANMCIRELQSDCIPQVCILISPCVDDVMDLPTDCNAVSGLACVNSMDGSLVFCRVNSPITSAQEPLVIENHTSAICVGKILSKRVSFAWLKGELSRQWSPIGEFQLITIPPNYFICIFRSPDARDIILRGGPWIVARSIIGLHRWTSSFSLEDMKGFPSPIWVCFPQIPLMYWDSSNIAHMAAMIGEPL
ncbi:hypothetical protein M5K25_017930 [Dendrobium thyrsiflorum]|uniref:DUF4283 domain-containing protein n=1 Tax=Dendrobium thyrsiflorum TaxID=117978 RepID=A0ABD0UHN4_DENTH